MKGVGIYSAEEAISYSLSGANLRCTGVNWDLRKDEPYSIYDRFDFDIPVGSVEMLVSLRLPNARNRGVFKDC